jgi:predicted kinase
VARLLHLNGPPGIGKSTLARRYAAEHPGVLNCDIDVLRTLIGGWEDDFAGAGGLIRPAALAFVGAYLAEGHDVVLPQMLARVTELERFEAAATEVGAGFVTVMLMDDESSAIARFHARGAGDGEAVDPWHEQVRRIVADEGGDGVLTHYHRRLREVLAVRPDAVEVTSVDGDLDATYRAVLTAVGATP